MYCDNQSYFQGDVFQNFHALINSAHENIRSLLVLTMKINVKLAMQEPFDINPLTKLWKTFFNLGFLNKNP